MHKENKIAFLIDLGVPYQQAVKTVSDNDLESALAYQLNKYKKLQGYKRQFRLGAYLVGGGGKGLRKKLNEAGLKDWKIDFVYLQKKIAIEVEGGAWIRGRHNRGVGFINDIEKYNIISLQGFLFLRVTAEHIFCQEGYTPAIKWIIQAMMQRN